MAVVYVPFVQGQLNPATWKAVVGAGYPAQFLALDPTDDGAYGRLVRRLWGRARDFVICEQDVVPTANQLRTIQECGHGWCSYGYDSDLYPEGPYFGLVRFGAQVMEAHPLAAHVGLHRGPGKEFEVGWWEVDSMLARDLKIRGVPWHQHTPPVHHAHPGPATEAPKQ